MYEVGVRAYEREFIMAIYGEREPREANAPAGALLPWMHFPSNDSSVIKCYRCYNNMLQLAVTISED